MAENDATQTDATEKDIEQGFKDESEEAQEEFNEDELSPREKAIEELVSKRNDEFEEETGQPPSSEEAVEAVAEVEEEKPDEPAPIWRDGDSWYTTCLLYTSDAADE
mgnify:CR=1 FL=1